MSVQRREVTESSCSVWQGWSVNEPIITTFAERPDLIDLAYEMSDAWPTFMNHDPVANALLGRVIRKFPELCLIATVDDRVMARALAIPFLLDREGRGDLPDGGWDRVLIWGMADHADGVRPDSVSALEIAIDADYLGQGLSMAMLAELRSATARGGFTELVAPVRPTHKHLQPHLPMDEYAALTREDGLPVDPWLRVHVRAGGIVAKVAHTSMVIAGSLDQWRDWTGLPFDRSGEIEVPDALVPVRCDLTHNHAVYVEPNVWIRHTLVG